MEHLKIRGTKKRNVRTWVTELRLAWCAQVRGMFLVVHVSSAGFSYSLDVPGHTRNQASRVK